MLTYTYYLLKQIYKGRVDYVVVKCQICISTIYTIVYTYFLEKTISKGKCQFKISKWNIDLMGIDIAIDNTEVIG